MTKDNGFFDIKSQEEIDNEKNYNLWWVYFVFSFGITIIFYILIAAALIKYLLS